MSALKPGGASALRVVLTGLLLSAGLAGCGAGEAPPESSPTPSPTPAITLELGGPLPYATLSEYGLFKRPMNALEPVDGVLPFEVISPLYSDHAEKPRFLILPPGQAIDFSEDDRWDFPDGSILVKNFRFPLDQRDPSKGHTIIETRLLIRNAGKWTAHTYRWNAEQDEAELLVAGAYTTVYYTDLDGNAVEQLYQIPNTNQCKNCHQSFDAMVALGPRTRQLNTTVERDGKSIQQLAWLEAQGAFSAPLPGLESLPALSAPFGNADLADRARSYLEANCAHCHQPGAAADASGLVLAIAETNPYNYGVCRAPVATGTGSGGFLYDIVPREPENSIVVYRMHSLDPELKMPEMGTLTVDAQGTALIEAWIDAMTFESCD